MQAQDEQVTRKLKAWQDDEDGKLAVGLQQTISQRDVACFLEAPDITIEHLTLLLCHYFPV